MSVIYDDIREALDSALAGLSGLPEVFFRNAPEEDSTPIPYLSTRISFTSRRPATRGPNPQHRYEGIYRIIICVPKRSGTGQALRYAEILTQAFDGSTDIDGATKTVSIDFTELASDFEQDPYWCIPVDVNWYIYDR